MLLELHAHTSAHSKCSVIEPVTLAGRIIERKLQGLVITEHGFLWAEKELAELRKAAGLPDGFILLAGEEVDTDIGHVLIFGAESAVGKKTAVAEIRARYPEAALILAHPFRNGRIPDGKTLKSPLLDGIEIFNVNHSPAENYSGLSFWHRYKFTALAGSDTHSPETAGVYPVQFDHPVSSIKELVSEIKAGRCRPFFKEIPKSGSNLTVTEITMGTKGEDETRSRLILKKYTTGRQWVLAKRSAHVSEMLHEKGFDRGLYRVPEVIEENDAEMLVIEESQRGRNLFELLTSVHPDTGMKYYLLAAEWLAVMHALKLKDKTASQGAVPPLPKLDRYLEAFKKTGNPRTKDAEKIALFVEAGLKKHFKPSASGTLIMIHGDYHPKNIIIGQDRMQDISTIFISVIDFNSSLVSLAEHDVGYFISQFRSQFGGRQDLLSVFTPELFIETYLRKAGLDVPDAGFMEKVAIFRARAALSISAFLIKVGKGESRELDSTLDAALEISGLN